MNIETGDIDTAATEKEILTCIELIEQEESEVKMTFLMAYLTGATARLALGLRQELEELKNQASPRS